MTSKAAVSAGRLCFQPMRQVAVVRGGQRSFGTSAVNGVNYSQVPKPLQNKMKLFQVPNGLPVHVKGGLVDKVLYGITAIACGLGLLECCRVIYVLSYPQKKAE